MLYCVMVMQQRSHPGHHPFTLGWMPGFSREKAGIHIILLQWKHEGGPAEYSRKPPCRYGNPGKESGCLRARSTQED